MPKFGGMRTELRNEDFKGEHVAEMNRINHVVL